MNDLHEITKKSKIFISHSSQDKEYVSAIVELLKSIGLSNETIFCSSIEGYDIPLDENIFDYLRKQFHDFNLRVIFCLSTEYYNSAVCLNEMGAAWVLKTNYTTILLPGFSRKNVTGVIDSMRTNIKMDDNTERIKSMLNDLRDKILDEFNLPSGKAIIWERNRDEFIKSVTHANGIEEKIQNVKSELCRPGSELLIGQIIRLGYDEKTSKTILKKLIQEGAVKQQDFGMLYWV